MRHWKHTDFTLLINTAVGGAMLLIGACPSAADNVYRCVDADGHTEFRQTACAGSQGQRLRVEVPMVGWIKSKMPAAADKPDARREQNDDSPQTLQTVNSADEKRCWRAEQRLERIQWQLRKGYKRAQGERLRRQRREQEAVVRRFCR